MADGGIQAQIEVDDSHYYQILSEYVGVPIEGNISLCRLLKSLASMQKEYEKVSNAVCQVRLKGYGVVTPDRSEIVLDEPAANPPRQQIRCEDESSGAVHQPDKGPY